MDPAGHQALRDGLEGAGYCPAWWNGTWPSGSGEDTWELLAWDLVDDVRCARACHRLRKHKSLTLGTPSNRPHCECDFTTRRGTLCQSARPTGRTVVSGRAVSSDRCTCGRASCRLRQRRVDVRCGRGTTSTVHECHHPEPGDVATVESDIVDAQRVSTLPHGWIILRWWLVVVSATWSSARDRSLTWLLL